MTVEFCSLVLHHFFSLYAHQPRDPKGLRDYLKVQYGCSCRDVIPREGAVVRERKRLLIWGTTYPEFSAKYYETVCTGAVDSDTGGLIRLYPITLRFLKDRFRHYNWIEGTLEPPSNDFRPESRRIDQDTIEVLDKIETGPKGRGWEERAEWILRDQNVFNSLEALREQERMNHTSLGLVKPKRIIDIFAKRKSDTERQEWEEKKAAAMAQRDIFVDVTEELDELSYIPVEYRVRFECDDEACIGEHDLSIHDWGVYQMGRKQFARGGPHFAERSVLSKLQEIMDLEKKDFYFFLGNTRGHCESFMVVGFFYPPKQPQHKLF